VDSPDDIKEPTVVTRPGRPRPAASRSQSRAALDTATLVIASEGGQTPTVEVDLMGVLYDVTPPKSASAMRIAWLSAEKDSDPDAVMQALEAWIDKAFGDQADDVRRRLYEDDDDPLDFPHIMTLMNKLVELNSGLPTMPR
jgi:hypothetical protein